MSGIQGGSGGGGTGEDDLTGPEFTYTGDLLTQVDYDDGSYKTFSYTGSRLDESVLYLISGTVITKTFNYTGDTLTSITEVIT